MNSIDSAILYFFNRTIKCPFLDVFFGQVSNLDMWAVVILIFILVRYFQEKALKYPLPALIVTWFTSDATSDFLKNLFHRPRPGGTLPWVTVMETTFSYSLPSGHAVVSMVYAVILSWYYPKFSFAFYAIAGLIGLSRIYLGVHYLTDVLMGFIIGGALGYLILKLQEILVKNFKARESLE